MSANKVVSLVGAVFLFSLMIRAIESSEPVIHIKSVEQFDRILQSGNFVVAYFNSRTCGACKVVHEPYYEMAKEYSNVTFLDVCIGAFSGGEKLVNRYSVPSYPSFVFFDKAGQKVDLFSGASEQTREKIAAAISRLTGGSSSLAKQSANKASLQKNVQMMQQPEIQQSSASPNSSKPNVMQPVQQKTQPMVKQPAIAQQDVTPIITYPNAPAPVTIMNINEHQLQPQDSLKRPRFSRRRRLGRRRVVRRNDLEYQ